MAAMNDIEREDSNRHAARVLEFDLVRQALAELCLSEGAAKLVLEEPFLTEKGEAERRVGLTDQYETLYDADEALPSFRYPPIDRGLKMMKAAGAVLDAEDLWALAAFIDSAVRLKRHVVKVLPASELRQVCDTIPDLSSVVKEISRYIDQEGRIREDKIPALLAIQKKLKDQKRDLENLVGRYLDSKDYSGIWQADVPTQKDGRTVLALKSNFKGRVKGVVHDVSSTGSTLFVEPLDVLDVNNRIVETQNEYRRELLKILRELTDAVRPQRDEIALLKETAEFIDAVQARARYSRMNHSAVPRLDTGRFRLLEARHPFLGSRAVPLDIVLDEGKRIVIVTGPNTGGKTVALKTAGLLSLMVLFGMKVPASPDSEFPIFDGVYADIGDEQSLHQSLSTFSGHMRNIADIIRDATSRSLVLLDELGAGTDPEEGSALAMALLDEFIARGTTVLVTTHHGILKNYGYTHAGALNASMSFDEASLAPTYKIVMGLPGKSQALVIARRNGLEQRLAESAERYLSDERNDVGRLIEGLTDKQHELHQIEKGHEERTLALKEEQRRSDLFALTLKQKERELRSQGIRELSKLLDESRKRLETLVREIREGELTKDKTKAVKAFFDELDEKIAAEQAQLEAEAANERSENLDLRPGLRVRVPHLGRTGILVRPDKKDGWIVEADSLRLNVKTTQIEALPDADAKVAVVPMALDYSVSTISAKAVMTLDVRGDRLDEALRRVEAQVDAALLSGLTEFGIVHGKGDGILQQGIHRYLEDRKPQIRDFHFARPEFGGSGKTIVVIEG